MAARATRIDRFSPLRVVLREQIVISVGRKRLSTLKEIIKQAIESISIQTKAKVRKLLMR